MPALENIMAFLFCMSNGMLTKNECAVIDKVMAFHNSKKGKNQKKKDFFFKL